MSLNRTLCIAIFACALQLTAVARGATLVGTDIFRDTFDRPNNNDIDAVDTGITNNTGTTFGSSAVYSHSWIDPNSAAPTFGAPDGNAANGGGQQILSNQYRLKYGAGTSNSFVNHNFTNTAILAAGGFSVSLDVAAYSQTTNGQGAAFAIGMSLADAQAGKDAFEGSVATFPPGFKYTNAFQNGTTNVATPANVMSDFYLAIRGNSTLAWGTGTGNSGGSGAPAPTFVAVPSKTGTISADFRFDDFNAGSTVNYIVYFNGVAQGSGMFTWSGTNENYIGLDGRDSSQMLIDNFAVTVPEPATTVLSVMCVVVLGGRRRLV